MKLEGPSTCPHCKKDHDVSFDLDKLDVKAPPTEVLKPIATPEAPQIMAPQEVKEPEVQVKTVVPSDEPYYPCANGECGKGLHKNPNYTVKPNKKCKNCDTLNGKKKCKNCSNQDEDEFDELDDDELKDLNIPLPEEHDHDHTHED